MLGIVLPLVVFYIAVSKFTHGVATEVRWQVFTISLVATILLTLISESNPTLPGSLAGLAVAALVCLAGLIFWLKVTRLQALKITGSYIGFIVAYSLVFGLIAGLARG